MRIAALLRVMAAGPLVCGCAMAPPAAERWTEPVTDMIFVRVDSGRFTMGSPPDERGREVQEWQHQVTIAHPFWLGAFEVTQRQWRQVMDANPSWFNDGDDRRPVESVTWFEVHDFLDRLSRTSPGSHFRLPTEAEWEFACRAGATTPYGTGVAVSPANANVAATPEAAATGQTKDVGSFASNAWGFHDMHGNVWEWTEDDHCSYAAGDVTDPLARCHSPLKVIRGGSWYFGADSARCALRYTHRPQDRGFSLGFRVVREPSGSSR